MLFQLFKREKLENSLDMENVEIELPTSKKRMTLAQLANAMDKIENMHGYASDDHMVKCGDEEMSVKKLASSYAAMKKEKDEAEEKKNKKNSIDPNDHSAGVGNGDKNKELALNEEEKKKKEEEDKKNAAGDDAKKEEEKKNALEESKKKLEEAQKLFNELSAAHSTKESASAPSAILLGTDMVARGKEMF